ncbi:protein kinase [Komarekiella sp. 'clone 1']|uniref:non-specific serine/threonine protein kinase n=1 Tax=Komarekiella delphini-convector SJRDD-AB1 TaxID=2593771 RepID=A0AA40VUY7_9NOST|nr:serine/threonine-protein kinase [Komarekiella delphini-convector]MBD6620640.1 protein kinase [Komarekiella delphini-convector SJRDD-AB1]
MSCYCINPLCSHRQNPDNIKNCLACGTSLLINDRIYLVKPLKALTDDPYNYFDVFEVDDIGTQENLVRERRVMKVLKWSTPKLRKFIEEESLALQLIQHPNIPKSTLDDFFTFVPTSPLTLHCLVMDKIEGQDLEQWIESNGRISQSQALEWLKQLVEMLDTVHRSDFFHRDIKPSNIILQPNGQLALVDFGTVRRLTNTYLAKVSGSGGTNDGRGGRYEITAVVTPRYTPLEQIEGQAVPQSDFFALGRTFIQLVTGVQLMDLPKDEQTGRLIWRNEAQQIDKPFADFIDELMAPLPGQRPQTTRVILQRLERLPFKSKLHRVITSKSFQIGAGVLGALSLFGLFYISLPVIANYYLNQGKKAQQENRLTDAQGDFQTAIKFDSKLSPIVANYFFEQGKKAHKENRFADAEKYFQAAVKYQPDLTYSVSSFYIDLGFRNKDAPQLARNNYELAIKYNPKDDVAYNNLAVACQQLQDYNCVSNTYELIFKLKPNAWESRYGLGTFYDERGKYDLAEKQYQLAIKSSSEAIFAIAALSRLENKSGDYNTAITLALQGLSKTENRELQASFYKDLGWAKLMQNRLSESKKYLEKAIDLDGQRIDAYCLLSQVQEALGENDDARISISACILGKSGLPEVLMWREDLLDRILKK